MEIVNKKQYEEWLVTISSTRLIYNTMDELETMLDNHNIRTNGIKRCYNTPQKMRACFRDLSMEVSELTCNQISLDILLPRYKKAWKFYDQNLKRRKNTAKIAMEILAYTNVPYKRDGYSKKKTLIYNKIIENDIDEKILILLLMNAFHGYDSKDGDAKDMKEKYDAVISLLEHFTCDKTMFASLPVISLARNEKHKSRIMLLYHTMNILQTFNSYADSSNLYDTSSSIKDSMIHLNLEGFWNESNGKLESTEFWQIEETQEDGIYIWKSWKKTADNHLIFTKYSVFLFEDDFNQLVAYILHPEAIPHRIAGLKYGDRDHVWYQCDMPDNASPNTLYFDRRLASSKWQSQINLTRVNDKKVISQYNKWIEECVISEKYPECNYELYICIWAITNEHIFIKDEDKNKYYKVPIDAYNGFEHITMNDKVGILKMNNKKYLAFDDFLLYIPITPKRLNEYKITVTSRIE